MVVMWPRRVQMYTWLVLLALSGVARSQLRRHYYPEQPVPRHFVYTFRTARADDSSYENQSGSSSSYPSTSSPSASSSYYRSNSQLAPAFLSSRSYASSTLGVGGSASATVIKHPSTCSYDRSHSACTFSLLCYLASGVPIEGCDDNPSMTCCYLQLKPVSRLSSGVLGKDIVYRQYASASSTEPTTISVHHSSASYPSSINSLSNYFLTTGTKLRSSSLPLVPDSSMSSPKISQAESSYGDYAPHQKDLFAPYDLGKSSYGESGDGDYLSSNAIRRTRTENIKSIFQEIANRKLYARNYEIEDICGKPMAKPRSRIIGGQDAYFGEFPWQVHIKITKHQCGGALINSNFIVTAAHCIYQAPMHQLNVIIGAHDIEDHRFQDTPPQYFGVSKVILHPNFRFSASHPDRYDIALIKLDSPVKFSDSVLPVCLPDENFQFEGWKGVVTGWGKTDPTLSNRYGTRLLQKVDVPIIDNDKCENWHRTRGIDLRIFSEMMCAGYEDGQKDACVGDSGGPLVINVHGRWTLAGITSAGFGCAQSRQPGIYHRVSHTVTWIRQTLQNEEHLI